jgi:hypothetical protein
VHWRWDAEKPDPEHAQRGLNCRVWVGYRVRVGVRVRVRARARVRVRVRVRVRAS